jgi:molybdopterin converting factor small subunit
LKRIKFKKTGNDGMVRAKVELMPTIRRLRDKNIFDLELPEGVTVKTMLRNIGLKDEEMEHLRIFINKKLVSLNEKIRDGDEVWVGLIVGGG